MALKKHTYKYIGSILPKFPTDKFTVPLYEGKGGKLFTHIASNEIIKKFEEVNVLCKINYTRKPVEVSVGSKAIYCFTNRKNEIVDGVRDTIEPILMSLLYSHSLNDNSKVVISSFLKLHGITYDLIINLEKSFSIKGLSVNIDFKNYINTVEQSNLPRRIRETINNKYLFYKNINNNIYIGDCNLIHNMTIYFDQFHCHIDEVLKVKFINDYLNELISASIKNNRIDLKQCLAESNNMYIYILTNSVDIDQAKIDSILSSKIKDIPVYRKSVIEVGLSVDIQLGNLNRTKKKVEKPRKKQDRISALFKDVENIINYFNKK